MSKSPNIFLPALGGAVADLALAYGWASRDYGADKIALLESRNVLVVADASAALDQVETSRLRAEALEAEIATRQAEAVERAAMSADLTAPAPSQGGSYGLGRVALADEIAAWDFDVLPDGRGLPQGKGDVWTGEEVFADRCASCQGDFAEGVDNWPVLAGGFDTLANEDPVKTVGSYWPHLSTAWDYI